MKNSLELAEVIKALREELNLAIRGGEGEQVKFNVNNIDLEFQTAVEKEGSIEAGGKIKFWVLDIDGKVSGKYKKASAHTIKISLEPIVITKNNEGKTQEVRAQVNDKA